jgi:hypothetical protein
MKITVAALATLLLTFGGGSLGITSDDLNQNGIWWKDD